METIHEKKKYLGIVDSTIKDCYIGLKYFAAMIKDIEIPITIKPLTDSKATLKRGVEKISEQMKRSPKLTAITASMFSHPEVLKTRDNDSGDEAVENIAPRQNHTIS